MEKRYEKLVSYVGSVFESKNYGKGEIVGIPENWESQKNPYFIFKFYDTGGVAKVALTNLKSGAFKDPSIKKLSERRIGEVFQTRKSGSGEIVGLSENRLKSGNHRFLFKFHETGNIVDVTYRNLVLGNVKDFGVPSVIGIGYSYKGASKSDLYQIWKSMLERCYSEACPAYPQYGGRGVKVSREWLHFKNFEKDCVELEGYENFLTYSNKFTLDKDRKGDGKLYSKETCEFSSKKKQSTFNVKETNVVSTCIETGVELLFYSASECARYIGTCESNVSKVLMGKRKSVVGHTVRKLEDSFLKPITKGCYDANE